MRIITGSAKGTKLKAPHGFDTRPTADRVKESLFNILGDLVIDARVLDIFSGTGNLALEALSRGAAAAVLVDKSHASVTVIKDNAQRTKLQSHVQILPCDVIKALEQLAKAGQRFDLVFCDPPYNKGWVQEVLQRLDDLPLLTDGAILVFEHSRSEVPAAAWRHLEIRRTERYGDTVISFLRYTSKQEVIQ